MKKRVFTYMIVLLLITGVSGAVGDDVRKEGVLMEKNAARLEVATVAGGCFWCMEQPFEKLDGVTDVVSGYTGGHKENPTYEQVSSGTTGHTEAVQITFDPGKIGYSVIVHPYF